jgi:hypothetical protein
MSVILHPQQESAVYIATGSTFAECGAAMDKLLDEADWSKEVIDGIEMSFDADVVCTDNDPGKVIQVNLQMFARITFRRGMWGFLENDDEMTIHIHFDDDEDEDDE